MFCLKFLFFFPDHRASKSAALEKTKLNFEQALSDGESEKTADEESTNNENFEDEEI